MKFTGGLPETLCGMGSTLATTEHLRSELPPLLRSLGVRWVLDAPCGDFHWLSKADLSGMHYTGVDNQKSNLAIAKLQTCNAETKWFFARDLLCEDDGLPDADLVICRDFLQHLPNARAGVVLNRLSAYPWLLLTSHAAEENTDIERNGDFHPLNLMAPPFSLPPPERAIEDPPGSGRILGLWSGQEVQRHWKD